MPITTPQVGPIPSVTIGSPDPTPTPTDTSARDAQVAALAAQHGGTSGEPSQVRTAPTSADPQGIDTGYDLYTFGDGTSVEVMPTGETRNLKLAPAKAATKTTTATPLDQMVRIDAQGKAIAPDDTTTPAVKLVDPKNASVSVDLPNPKPGAQPSGQFAPVPDPRDPTKTVGMVDTGDNSYHALTTTAGNNQVLQTTTGVYSFDPAEKDPTKALTLLTTIDKSSPRQVVHLADGTDAMFDPSEKDPTKALTPLPSGAPQQIKDAEGNTLLLQPDGTYKVPPGVTAKQPAVATSTNTQARELVSLDQQGNVVKREPNPNYVPPTPTQLTPDLVSANVPVLKSDGTIQFVPNQNRVTAGQAMQDLLAQVGVKVNGKEVSMADAKDMLTGAAAAMNAQSQATNAQAAATNAQTNQATQIQGTANDLLTNAQKAATTGAGMLQQRAQTAQGMLSNILGTVTGDKNFGIAGGTAPANIGADLTQGIAGYTAQLMGGQDVMDTAARLVQQADPKSPLSDPSQQTAVGVLTQMLQKYQDLTGGQHPAVAATNALNSSATNGGVTAPVAAGAANAAGAGGATGGNATAAAAPAAAGTGFTSPVYGGLAQGGANLGGMNLYPTPGSTGSPIAGLAQGGGQGAFPFAQRLQQLQGFTAPGGSGSSPTIVINAGGG